MGPLVHFPLSCLTAQVYRIAWWMGHYNSKSPKRHLGLTKNVWTDKLNKGKLSQAARQSFSMRTVNRTISKSGKIGYQGNSNLKKTQILVYDFISYCCIFCFFILDPPQSMHIQWVFMYVHVPTYLLSTAKGVSTTIWGGSLQALT